MMIEREKQELERQERFIVDSTDRHLLELYKKITRDSLKALQETAENLTQDTASTGLMSQMFSSETEKKIVRTQEKLMFFIGKLKEEYVKVIEGMLNSEADWKRLTSKL